MLAAVLYGTSAYAVVDPYEVMQITPAEGVVTSLQHFTITFADLPVVVNESAVPTLQKGGGATVEGHMRLDADGTTVLVDFDESYTASGQYFLNLPEGSLTVNGQRLLPLTLRFSIDGSVDSFYEQITIDPAEGEVESLQYFTISLPQYVTEIEYGSRATLTNKTTGKSYIAEIYDVGFKVLVNFSREVTEAGEYTLTIPDGAIVVNALGGGTRELNFNYTIVGVEPTFYDEITINPAEGRVQSLQNFTITFPQYVTEIASGSMATLTNTVTGVTRQAEMVDVGYDVIVNFADEITENGRYRLTIPAGAIVVEALGEEVHELNFDYTIAGGDMPDYTINPPEGEVHLLQYFTIAYGEQVIVDEDIHPVLANTETGDSFQCNALVIGANAVVYLNSPTSVPGNYLLVIPPNCITIESTGQSNPEMFFHYTLVEKDTYVPPVIEKQPEGELRLYHRTGGVVREVEKESFEEGENPYELITEQQEGVINIVFGEDNKVYMQRPVSWSYYDGWVEGTLSDDGKTITVPMGQYVAYTKSLEMAVQVGVFAYDEAEDTYVYDAAVGELTYTINEDGTITQNGTDQYLILGTMNRAFGENFQYLDFEWLQAGDYATVYRPVTEQPIAPPEDLETEEYYLSTANFDGIEWEPYLAVVAIGVDGDDVWLQGLSGDLPKGWIKGTDNHDGTITFPEGQLLGSNEALLYFKNAKYDPVTGNLTQRDLVLTSVGEDTYNTYDYVFITADRNSFYYINFYQGLTISKHLDVAVEAPADLETEEYYFNYKTIYETNGTMVEVQAIVDLGVYGDEVYIKGLWEYLPDAWTKGKFVDGKFVLDLPQFVGNYKEEYLGTYPIYVVGFDEHTGLVEPQVTMDYNTTTHVFSNPSKPFGIGINKTGYLNLQDFYEASLVPVYAPGSVTSITADGTGAVEYYDLQGRIITDPATATGIIIVKNADGSVKKVLRK